MSSEYGGVVAGQGQAAGYPASLSPYFAAMSIVESSNACALPGVSIKYDTFIPAMWHAVSTGHVLPEHARFVADGLTHGFRAGFEPSRMTGHRWFKNYPSALTDFGIEAVSRATMKRVQVGKTLDLGTWTPALASALKLMFVTSAIFPVGAVPKPLEPTELRPTDDHTRTGFNAASTLDFLRHSLDTYNEIAWFLRQDYFMRVSDVDAAFPMLPLHPALWPYMMFRFPTSTSSATQQLYMHVTGDFGTAGMPGCFKIFFVDVVVNMARSFAVLSLPMPVFVDDVGLIGPDSDEVNDEMSAFHAWAWDVCGVAFKVLKDRLAARRQLMLGFWWDSATLTRSLEERKLLAYIDMLAECAARPTLTLRDMQSVAGKMQRAILTFPPGAACLLVSMFALMAGLKLPWHRRKVTAESRADMRWVRYLLQLNAGMGHYSLALFAMAPAVVSDASRQSSYTGGGYVSQCGMYNFWRYGSRAARQLIDYLEGDTVTVTCREMAHSWWRKIVPFGIDNMVFERSAARGRSKVPRLNVLVRELFCVQVQYQFVLQPFWLSSEANEDADHLSRGREAEFLKSVYANGFWSPSVVPIRHGTAGSVRRLPENRGDMSALSASVERAMQRRDARAASTMSSADDSRARPLEESHLGTCPSNPTGNSASHLRFCLSSVMLLRRVLVLFLMLPAVGAAPFGVSVHYARASLFEGLAAARAARLEELLDNRFRPSSWRKIHRGLAIWRELAAGEGWSAVISTDDVLRGAKLVTYALHLADETELTYKSIETYLWGMRTWQTLQGQADPALGVMGWDAFMSALKVLTWSVSEPRKQTPIWVVEAILDSLDTDSFEDVQFGNLMLDLLYTYSRAECPLPLAHTGREAFDKGKHWRVCDFDARFAGGRTCLAVRFQAIKQDPRVERPEAAGNQDWAYLGSVPKSKWCPVMWAQRLQAFHGARPDADAPYFVSPWDKSKAYLYGAATAKFHRLQRAVGVPDEEITSFHGLRVCGYNGTKSPLGEDLAVAHGMWKSTAHKRYDRFDMSEVVRIPAAIAGLDEGSARDPFAEPERAAGVPPAPLVRRSAVGAPDEPEEADLDSAASDQDEPQPSVVRAPPGWRETVKAGRNYSIFYGPGGIRRYSMAAAWRAHEDRQAPSPRAAASIASEEGEEPEVVAAASPAPRAVTAAAGAASSSHPTTSGVGFPATLDGYVLERDRESTRPPPRQRVIGR